MAGFLALGDCRARFVARSLVSWAGRLRLIGQKVCLILGVGAGQRPFFMGKVIRIDFWGCGRIVGPFGPVRSGVGRINWTFF